MSHMIDLLKQAVEAKHALMLELPGTSVQVVLGDRGPFLRVSGAKKGALLKLGHTFRSFVVDVG